MRPERCRECGLAGRQRRPARASSPESVKSWGRRGKAPEKVSATKFSYPMLTVAFALVAGQSGRPDAGVARRSNRTWPRLHRGTVSANGVRTRPATACGRPEIHEGDAGCSGLTIHGADLKDPVLPNRRLRRTPRCRSVVTALLCHSDAAKPA
jgi:hypothetical protein